MSTDTRQANSTRMVHPSLGGSAPFFRGMTLSELGLFVVPPFGGFLVVAMLPSNIPASPVFALVAALEILLLGGLKAKPPYYRLTEWLGIQLMWGVQDDHYGSGDADTDTATAVRLQRVHDGAVERLGGHYVGAVEVEPANMALEDEETWRDAVDSLTNFVSSTVEYDTKLYITARDVDEEAYVEAHRDRLTDRDVSENPVLGRLLEDFVHRRTDEDGSVRQVNPPERRYYVVTWVTDEDVLDLQTDDGLLDGLAMIPLVGRLFDRVSSDGMTDEEIDAHKCRKLEDQLEELRRGIANLHRCRPRQLESHELARLVREYWACGTEDVDMSGPLASPLVGGSRSADGESVDPDDDEDAGGAEDSITRPQRHQRRTVAPGDIEWNADHAVINGEKHARTFWVEAFPEQPSDGFLQKVILDTDLEADISVHLEPYDSQSAADLVGDWIASLEATKKDSSQLKQEDIEQEIQQAKQIRQLVRRNETSLVRTGVFIRVTADSEEELRRRSNRLQSLMRDSPANCIVKKVVRRPEKGMATVSPIGRNELGTDRLSTMTAEAIGAMFPFASNYVRMESGIQYGTHAGNGSEVIIDPWDLETGHSELVTGMPGAGKSHASQARGLRSIKRRSDTLQVIVDPVGGMRGTAEALNAKYITVSGKTPLNPCEMQPTPEHMLEKSRDMQPVAAKKDELFGVVENFLASRDIDLEMHSGVVTHVIDTIFARSDIDPDDPTTHTPANSPTMQDFLDVLDELTERPEAFEFNSQAVRDQVIQYASELSVALQPFRAGSTYANLSKRSDMDIINDDHKVVYLDLQQVEGSGDGMGKQSFIMQLLLSTIYQQAKRTEKNVEVIIDEAHYLFNDTENLSFLNQIARHQRHAGIRLVMLTQTLQEFYDGGAAEEIASMCPIKVHHREPGLDDDTAERADLTDAQQWYIQSAEAGKQDTGYSEGLVRVDEHGDYPIRITTSDAEKTVIEYDDDSRDELEAILEESDPEHIQELRDLLENEAVEAVLAERYDVPERVARKLVEKGLSEQELVAGVAAAVEGKLRNNEEARQALKAARTTIERSDDDTVAADGGASDGQADGDDAADRHGPGSADGDRRRRHTGIRDSANGADRDRSTVSRDDASGAGGPSADEDETAGTGDTTLFSDDDAGDESRRASDRTGEGDDDGDDSLRDRFRQSVKGRLEEE